MNWVLVIGLLMNAIALPIVARRVVFLYRLITSGQPAPGGSRASPARLGAAAKRQVVEVFGQKKLLKWSIPGAAHFFVFWAFLILGTVYIEAYGALFDADFAIPVIGHWAVLGFLQDFIALMALAGIITFAIIRLRNSPERLGRQSRFKGSHLGGRLGRAVHDLQRHLVAVPVPRRGLGARQPALRERRVRLDRHRQPARRARATRRWRSWRASACCCTSASCWCSSSSWCTPSTCTSSSRRST